MESDKKRIANNTIFLYFRMIITMIVALFTTRVVLEVLGVDDYGIYQTIGGFVAILGYLNGSLSVGSSRFLTYELGTGDFLKLQKTFSSVFYVHLIFASIVFILGETVGLWFLYYKLNIPVERISVSVWVYQLSIITSLFTITQVPYGASIISHERMKVYAYTSVVDAALKLLIVYLLVISPMDKLLFYSLLLFIQSVGMMCFYRWYCIRNFKETILKPVFDKTIIKNVLSYSGWNVFATTSLALCNQGVTVITNMFFNPGIVTARAVASTVNTTASHFVDNIRAASNPQIVKLYASGQHKESSNLLLSTTKLSFYLFYLIALPVCLSSECLLKLWLGEIPEYSVQFLQLAICTSIFAVFDRSFYTGLYAKGQIKENSLLSSSLFFIAFAMTYLLFKMGCSPLLSGWMLLIAQIVIALVVKPIMLVKIVNYDIKEIIALFGRCFLVVIVSILVPLIIYFNKDAISSNYYIRELIVCAVSIISVVATVWTIGLDTDIKQKVLFLIKQKLNFQSKL